MGLRSQNNPIASFRDVFSATGTDAMKPGSGNTSGMEASGGIINDYTQGDKVYRAHIFTSSGKFIVTQLGEGSPTANAVDFLVVGGGGGGGGVAARGAGGTAGYQRSYQGANGMKGAIVVMEFV